MVKKLDPDRSDRMPVHFLMECLILSVLLLSSFAPCIPSLSSTDGAPSVEDEGLLGGPPTRATVPPMLKKITNIHQENQNQVSHRNNILSYQGHLFYAYHFVNSTQRTVCLIHSGDNGTTWSNKIDIMNGPAGFTTHMIVWKGQLYMFIFVGNPNRDLYQLREVHINIDKWKDIRSATINTIISQYAAHFDIATDDYYLYLSTSRSNYLDGKFYRFDGTSWSSSTHMVNGGYCSLTNILAVGPYNDQRLYFFYSRPKEPSSYPDVDGKVRYKVSTNHGSTWSSAVAFMDRVSDYTWINLMDLNGTLLAFANRLNYDDIDMARSTDGGLSWSNEKVLITSRGSNTIHTNNPYNYAVGTYSGNSLLYLAFENSLNDTKFIYSNDWGANWISESSAIVVDAEMSYDPTLSNTNGFISYMVKNSTQYDVILKDLKWYDIEDFAPSALKAVPGYLKMDLSWKGPPNWIFDKYSFNRYILYRGLTPRTMSIYRYLPNITSFTDDIRSFNETDYCYAIRADFSGNPLGPFSGHANGTPLLPPVITGLTARSGDMFVDLGWEPLPSDVVSKLPGLRYEVLRGRYPDSIFDLASVQIDKSSYNDTAFTTEPRTYHYRVTYSLPDVGRRTPSELVSAKPNTPPSAPAGISFVDVPGGVDVRWTPPIDDGGRPVVSYTVHKGDSREADDSHVPLPAGARSYRDLNLTVGSMTFYSVSAFNRIGEGPRADPIMVGYFTISSPPQNFIAREVGVDIGLTWEPPAVTWGIPIDNYIIYRGTSVDGIVPHIEVPGSCFEFIDTVTPGIDYYYEISAENRFGESDKAGPVTARTRTLPGPIANITVVAGDGEVELRWEPPLFDGGSEVLMYELFRGSIGVQGAPSLGYVPDGLELYFDRGLENGVAYTYWIGAVNAVGKGPLTGPVSARPGRDPFSVSEIGGAAGLYSGRIWWEAPDEGGSALIGFNIYRGPGPNDLSMYTKVDINSSQEPSFTDTSLERGRTYCYAVTAVNTWGESDLSPVVPIVPLGRPSAPIVRGTVVGVEDFRASWDPPLDDGGSPVISYVLYFRTVGSESWDSFETTDDSLKVGGFLPGDLIEFTVSAKTILGEGETSKAMTLQLGEVPGAPDALMANPLDRGCRLSWHSAAGNGLSVLKYRIYLEELNGQDTVRIDEVDGTLTEHIVSGLVNGRTYTFVVSAVNLKGEGPKSPSAHATPIAKPGSVAAIWTESASLGAVLIRWKPPIDDGGTKVLFYRVYRSDHPGSGEVMDPAETATFYEDIDVVDGLTYYYYVSAVNAVGEGPVSTALVVTPMGVPGAPFMFEGTATTDTVTLTWGPPLTSGGTEVLGYLVFRGRSSYDMELIATLGPETTDLRDESVSEGTYFYQVAAYNCVGTGAIASVSVAVPGRTTVAAGICATAFLAPFILLLIIGLVMFLKRRAGRRKAVIAEKAAEPVPGAAKFPAGITDGRAAALGISPGTSMPALPTIMAQGQRPVAELPQAPSPVERALPPPRISTVDEMVTGSYIRPPDEVESQRERPSEQDRAPIKADLMVEPGDGPTGPEPPLQPEGPAAGPGPLYGGAGVQAAASEVIPTWTPEMVEAKVDTGAKGAIEMLKKLNELRMAGAITQDEYDSSKKRLLRSI